jgi:hypothetical protein
MVEFPGLHELVDKSRTDCSNNNWHPCATGSGKSGRIPINRPVDANHTAKIQGEVIHSASNPLVLNGGYQDINWRPICAGKNGATVKCDDLALSQLNNKEKSCVD